MDLLLGNSPDSGRYPFCKRCDGGVKTPASHVPGLGNSNQEARDDFERLRARFASGSDFVGKKRIGGVCIGAGVDGSDFLEIVGLQCRVAHRARFRLVHRDERVPECVVR